jgi:hypothetical protein
VLPPHTLATKQMDRGKEEASAGPSSGVKRKAEQEREDPEKRARIERPSNPFTAGSGNFEKVFAEGKFFKDNTGYIRILELELEDQVFLSLAPRRFGKTLFLNTLAEYYDKKNAEKDYEKFHEYVSSLFSL